MRIPRQLPLIALLLLFIACNRHYQSAALLARADSLMTAHPDSAYRLLDSIRDDARTSWRMADRMRYELTLADAMNKAYKDFTTDSVLKLVVRYYDRRGSRNQQLKARYLLGCAYRDMGEAPAAINAWKEAVDCADTTSTDCDYTTLYSIYGQMAVVFQAQQLATMEIDAYRHYSKYAKLAGNIYESIRGVEFMVIPYYQQQDTAKVFETTRKARDLYLKYGMTEAAARVYPTAISVAVQYGLYDRARTMMQIFEGYSGLFNKSNNIDKGYELYYQSKGLYYLGVSRLDSAEWYFRKLSSDGYHVEGYRGLLQVYQAKQLTDSIIRYTKLHEAAVFTMMSTLDAQATGQVASLYDYNRFQQDASKQRERALRNANQLIIVSVAALILIALALSLILQYRKRQRQKQEELNQMEGELMSAKQEYERNQLMLNNLKFIYHEALSEQKTAIAELTSRFSESEKALQTTIRNQSTHIEVLEQRLGRQTLSDPQLPLFSNSFITHIIEVAGKPNEKLSQADWNRLMEIWRGYYPKLSADLLANHEVTKQGLRVCLLTTLFLRGKDIANLLQVSSGRITNLRADVNEAMFGIKDAKALLPNLIAFYHIQQPYEENNNTEV